MDSITKRLSEIKLHATRCEVWPGIPEQTILFFSMNNLDEHAHLISETY
jgi:hypothetical protein